MLGPIESERKQVIKDLKVRKKNILIAAIFAILSAPKIFSGEMLIKVLMGIAIGSAILYFFSYQKIMRPYKKRFKQKIIHEIFKGMIGPCKFSVQELIPRFVFEDSRIINKPYNQYSGEDYLEGSFENINFRFSELLVQEIVKKGKNSETKTRFRGLFFVFKLPFHTKQRTLILKDKDENLFGRMIGRSLQKISEREGYKLVQLESLSFEREFTVYSDDQIRCRILLNPKTMENLVNFKKKHKDNINISIKDNTMYLAINSMRNYFEPNIDKQCISMNDVQEIYDIFLLISDLFDDLKLKDEVA